MSPSTGPRYSLGASGELARSWSAAAHKVRRTSARSLLSTTAPCMLLWSRLPVAVGARSLAVPFMPWLAIAAPMLPDDLEPGDESRRPGPRTRSHLRRYLVGATGFEPVTPSVSANSGEPLCG